MANQGKAKKASQIQARKTNTKPGKANPGKARQIHENIIQERPGKANPPKAAPGKA